jgi:hypothetical protein
VSGRWGLSKNLTLKTVEFSKWPIELSRTGIGRNYTPIKVPKKVPSEVVGLGRSPPILDN